MPRPNKTVILLLGVLATIMVGWVLRVGASILQPLVIALLLASMLQPVVRQFARWKIPPPLTVILIVSGLFYGMARGGLAFYSYVIKFAGATPEGVVRPVVLPEPGEESESRGAEISWTKLKENIKAKISETKLSKPAREFAYQMLDSVDVRELTPNLVGTGLGFMRSLILVVIYMLFIFAEQAVFRRKILAIADDRQDDARNVLDSIGRSIQRYLGVKTTISIATAVLCYLGLEALAIPNARLYGALTFLLNYIPTFGSIIAAIFPTITALANPSFEHPVGAAIGVILIYFGVNIALGSYLEPKILGRELNLSPLVIIICVVFWGGLWGIVGAFLAVPLTVLLQIVLASQENTWPIAVMLSSGPPRERRRRTEGDAEEESGMADETGRREDLFETRWRRPG